MREEVGILDWSANRLQTIKSVEHTTRTLYGGTSAELYWKNIDEGI
jgi:hypothetical protein